MLVRDGIVGIGIEADSTALEVTGGVETVAFPEAGGLTEAGNPDETLEGGTSEAGTLTGWLTEAGGVGEPEVPIVPEDGRMPTLGVGVALGVAGGRTLMLAVSEGVGTTPDDGGTDGAWLERGTGADPLGKVSPPEMMLDRIVGRADGGTSEIKDERIGGMMPDAEALGCVSPRSMLDGKTPGSSETRDDKREGSPSTSVLTGVPSEVGIASEL